MAVYPICGVIGFAVGYNVGATTRGNQLQHGIFGFFTAFFAAAIVLHVVMIVLGATRRPHA
jgi:uncharacterized membrane protein YeaQ/YmgE (transglycosylase-associated protein family)